MGRVIFRDLTFDQFLGLPRAKPPLEFIDGEVVRGCDDPVLYDRLGLDQFLRLPDAKPALEYLDGKVVQKVSPKRTHSVLQGLFFSKILEHARPRRLGLPYIELRCTFGGRSIVPDLCFIARGRIPKDPRGRAVEDVSLAPDLMIEFLSPGQTERALAARLTRCVADGVRLAWLVQLTKERVYIYRSGRPVEILGTPAILDGEDVLPDFTLSLTELFSWRYED